MRYNKKLTIIVQLFLIAAMSATAIFAAGAVDATFNPGLVQVSIGANAVQRIIAQPDGKILIAGDFRAAGKIPTDGIARLNADGTVDATFHASNVFSPFATDPTRYGGRIFGLALQPDGKILIGGDFTSVSGIAKQKVARLNADGSLDTSFNLPGTLFGSILDIKIAADGKIILAGGFTYGTQNNIIRVNSDGTPDASFTAPSVVSTGVIYSVVTLPDGKLLVGGITGGTTGNGYVYRLNTDGSVDSSFNAVIANTSNVGNPGIFTLRLQDDGKFLAGGGFSSVNGFAFSGVARFNADGTIDSTFNINSAGTNSSVFDIEMLPSGKIFIGGVFSAYNGVLKNRAAVLNSNGSLDNSFTYNGGLSIKDALVLPSGKILIGGTATSTGSFPQLQLPLERLNADGSLDTTFRVPVGSNGIANKVLVQPDGKILIGGNFNFVDGKAYNALVRLNADGTVDTTFAQLTLNGIIYGIDVTSSGKIVVATQNGVYVLSANGAYENGVSGAAYDVKALPGGGFVATVNQRVRKYSDTGVFDPTFDVIPDGALRKLVLQPDGKIIVVGDFSNIGGAIRGRIARLNANGTVDTTFNPPGGANGVILDAAVQADGKIIIGGGFTAVNFNTNYLYLARLNADGTLDTSFHPVVSGGGVQSLRIQPNGKILVGGAMTTVNGVPRSGIARINQDGTLDATFNPGAGANSSVLSIDLETNGNIIIGGSFTKVDNLDRLGVARLLSNNAARTPFDFDADGRADLSVFRPSNGGWYIYNLANNSNSSFAFGQQGDVIVPADYDGDGQTDIAVYRNGIWYLNRSTSGFTGIAFGAASDIPAPADFDGDGKAELAVFRPSTGSWFTYNLANGTSSGINFGQNGDRPVPADYDGDGKADFAVYRNGAWYLLRSTLGFTGVAFGDANDKTVPADYDGDGKTDIAVFRPSNGGWYILQSNAGFASYIFGQNGDAPTPADYDGDGKADIAVFRQGSWYLQRSTAGFTGVAFGATTDLAVPNAYVR